MPTAKITKRAVDSAPTPPAGKATLLWDDTLKGFGLKVTDRGARTFLVQYRIGGRGAKTRRYTIGPYGSPWTVEKARDRAADVLELVRKGIDPVDDERTRLAEQKDRHTANERLAFSPYADVFIQKHARARNLRSADTIEAVFRRELKPWFKAKPLPAIRRTDIRDLLDDVGKRGTQAANKAHKYLRKMFAWAVERGDIAASPMEGMGPPHLENRRKRKLEGDELRVVWLAAEKLGYPFGTFVKLLLLTGQRLREVAGMTWAEIDVDKAVWLIPGRRTKNGLDHLCPLNAQAVELLAAIAPDPKKRKGAVLTTNGTTPIAGFSKAKAALDRSVSEILIAEAAVDGGEPAVIEPWVFHDLRRTLATGCQSLGVPVEHTEAVLNHVSGKRAGIVGVYQLYDYQAEKTTALALWGQKIAALLAPPATADIHFLAAERHRA